MREECGGARGAVRASFVLQPMTVQRVRTVPNALRREKGGHRSDLSAGSAMRCIINECSHEERDTRIQFCAPIGPHFANALDRKRIANRDKIGAFRYGQEDSLKKLRGYATPDTADP